jgi:hypothetical protein
VSIEVSEFESYDFNLIVYSGKVTRDELQVFYSTADEWSNSGSSAWITYIDKNVDLSDIHPEEFGTLRRILLPKIHKLIEKDAGFCSIIVCNSQQAEAITNYWRDFIGRDRAERYYPIFFSDLRGACEWLGLPPSAHDAVLGAVDATDECGDPDPGRGPAPPPAAD